MLLRYILSDTEMIPVAPIIIITIIIISIITQHYIPHFPTCSERPVTSSLLSSPSQLDAHPFRTPTAHVVSLPHVTQNKTTAHSYN
jgi:hypothetical protein